MQGRKAKPISAIEAEGNKGRYTKEELERRRNAEIKPPNDNVECPKWLKGEARKEWNRISEELFDLGLLTNIDVGALAICCDAYGKYVQASRKIKATEMLIEHSNTAKKTNLIINPLIQITAKYADIYKKYMTEFGLSPSARARLAVANKDGEDEDDDSDLD
ncbi:phage terminase small subunit P27 family [Evansella cellulosilytica]|uniref:Phage terminase, small subunit, P27 family n=1 Tax=Evansella cellulosilytica (strain ATCC 21833 / DSM 2522 / FERM P-1141 / JCM 9156 / N-4) TaxID=649639 RepID=E6TVH3_EVAC2|nr:phage terminase small subunit P27 family [Evansella cellulosilytica]ADU30990.1 phage terminase, small subunit, P27 family [Evansella cellulosilytica DSM 2522]